MMRASRSSISVSNQTIMQILGPMYQCVHSGGRGGLVTGYLAAAEWILEGSLWRWMRNGDVFAGHQIHNNMT